MTTLNLQVGAGADDAWWAEGNTSFSNTSTSIYNGCYYDATYTRINTLFRLLNVTIGPGDTIDAATYQLKAATSNAQTVHAIISAIDAANAAAPTTYNGAENATRTTATVTWNSVPGWTLDTWYTSLEIKAIIQELVDIGGWSSGNALVIYVEDNGTPTTAGYYRRARSHDQASANAPKLDIDYTPAAGGVTVLAALAIATVLSPVSAVVTGAMVSAILATATALSPVSTHINTVSAPVATATALSPVSVVSGAAAVVGALATASALSWDATTSLGALVVGALGTATAQSYVALHINTVLASLSTATALSPEATVLVGGAVVVLAALATATALSYTATHLNTLSGALATATALSFDAVVSTGAVIAAILATATALSFDAAVIGGATIVAALSAATALSWAASINPGVTISAVLATATALAYAAVAVVTAKLLLKAGDAFGERADTVQGSASIAPLPIGHGLIDAPADAPQVEGSGRQ